MGIFIKNWDNHVPQITTLFVCYYPVFSLKTGYSVIDLLSLSYYDLWESQGYSDDGYKVPCTRSHLCLEVLVDSLTSTRWITRFHRETRIIFFKY